MNEKQNDNVYVRGTAISYHCTNTLSMGYLFDIYINDGRDALIEKYSEFQEGYLKRSRSMLIQSYGVDPNLSDDELAKIKVYSSFSTEEADCSVMDLLLIEHEGLMRPDPVYGLLTGMFVNKIGEGEGLYSEETIKDFFSCLGASDDDIVFFNMQEELDIEKLEEQKAVDEMLLERANQEGLSVEQYCEKFYKEAEIIKRCKSKRSKEGINQYDMTHTSLIQSYDTKESEMILANKISADVNIKEANDYYFINYKLESDPKGTLCAITFVKDKADQEIFDDLQKRFFFKKSKNTILGVYMMVENHDKFPVAPILSLSTIRGIMDEKRDMNAEKEVAFKAGDKDYKLDYQSLDQDNKELGDGFEDSKQVSFNFDDGSEVKSETVSNGNVKLGSPELIKNPHNLKTFVNDDTSTEALTAGYDNLTTEEMFLAIENQMRELLEKDK